MRLAATLLIAALFMPLAATNALPCHADLEVFKYAPDDPNQPFGFQLLTDSGDLVATWVLQDGQSAAFRFSGADWVPGTYVVRELPVAGWELWNIGYTLHAGLGVLPEAAADLAARSITVTLTDLTKVEAYFYNRIPEPTTLGMVGLGLGALFLWRRRRR